MFVRFMRLLLPVFFLFCLVSLGQAQEYAAAEGEIRFDGTLASFDEAGKSLVINVSSFTLPSGKTSKLAAVKPKTISLLPETKMQVKNAPGVLVTPYLKAGVRIVAIGKDAGTGKDVPARLVLVVPAEESPGAPEGGEPATGDPTALAVRAGETLYEGKVTGVLSDTVFTVSVAIETNAQGVTTEHEESQAKTVEVGVETDLHSRSDATKKLKFVDIKVGQRVTFVAKSGRPMKAREVALWDDDGGKTRYRGTVTISYEAAVQAKKGDEAFDARLYEESLKFYNRGLNAARGAGDSAGQGLIHARLGRTYLRLNQTNRAMESYQSALEVYRRTGNTESVGSTLLNISRIYAAAKDHKQARATVDEAINSLQAGGNSPVLAFAYSQRGHIQADQNETAEALESWQQALAISRQFNERDEESSLLGQIAMAQSELRQTANANETIEQLLALIPGIADQSEQAWAYYMAGTAYQNLGENAKAVENMTQAQTIFTAAGQQEDADNAQKILDEWAKPAAPAG